MKAIEPHTLQIPLIAHGKGWLAVDKPPGMTVHNDSRQDLCSFAASFILEEPEFQAEIDLDPCFGVHPVHRLDKDTSGILLLAVNREMFRFFSKQFEHRRVKKRYVALLHGRLENAEGDHPWGTWNWPLAGTAGGRHDPQGVEPRQESRTRYRALAHSLHYTLVEIELLSGRTHQIRRHAKLSGHPVVGDGRYGSTRAINYLKKNHGFNRLALHACRLTLQLPGMKKPTAVETAAIPNQIQDLFLNDSNEVTAQGSPRSSPTRNVVDSTTLFMPARAGIQENTAFPGPGFHRCDVQSTTLSPAGGKDCCRPGFPAHELGKP